MAHQDSTTSAATAVNTELSASSRPQISVVIPMHNEEDNAAPLINEITQELEPWAEFEIIAVDDRSTDSTLPKLLELKKSVPQLRVLQHRRNMGQSTAVVSGVYAAKYPLIATLDGDGQNNPADIIKLYATIRDSSQPVEALLIAGCRQKRQDNIIRLISSRLANQFRQKLLKDACPDSGCGLKLFARSAFLRIPHFNHVHRFLPALFMRAGATIINVPVSHRPRTRGTSKYGVMNRLWVGIVDIIGTAWLIRRPCRMELTDEL